MCVSVRTHIFHCMQPCFSPPLKQRWADRQVHLTGSWLSITVHGGPQCPSNRKTEVLLKHVKCRSKKQIRFHQSPTQEPSRSYPLTKTKPGHSTTGIKPSHLIPTLPLHTLQNSNLPALPVSAQILASSHTLYLQQSFFLSLALPGYCLLLLEVEAQMSLWESASSKNLFKAEY